MKPRFTGPSLLKPRSPCKWGDGAARTLTPCLASLWQRGRRHRGAAGPGPSPPRAAGPAVRGGSSLSTAQRPWRAAAGFRLKQMSALSETGRGAGRTRPALCLPSPPLRRSAGDSHVEPRAERERARRHPPPRPHGPAPCMQQAHRTEAAVRRQGRSWPRAERHGRGSVLTCCDCGPRCASAGGTNMPGS